MALTAVSVSFLHFIRQALLLIFRCIGFFNLVHAVAADISYRDTRSFGGLIGDFGELPCGVPRLDLAEANAAPRPRPVG